jgi:TolA-binding protein
MMRLRSIAALCLPLLFVVITMMSCGTKKALDFESGLKKYEAGELDEAIVIFEQIAQGGGSYANRARYYIGESYKNQFKWDKAIEQFQAVVDSEPPTSYLGVEARNRISQIREGRRDIERIKIIHDNNPGTDMAADALLELGSVYENKLNDYDNAVKTYKQLLEEFPGSPKAAQAQINIGYVHLYKTYDYVKAFEELKKINLENYPKLKFRVAEVEDLLRDFNKTQEEINVLWAFIQESQRRKIVPGRKIIGYELYGVKQEQVAQSFVSMAKKFRQLRNYPRAIQAYRMLIERVPLMLRQAAEARYGIAEIYQFDQRRYLEAIDAYDEYIKYHPTDFRRHEADYNKAICYETLRSYESAYLTYRGYRDTYPSGKYFQAAELKVRQYEYDEDQDGFAYYQELEAGTKDTDPNEHP